MNGRGGLAGTDRGRKDHTIRPRAAGAALSLALAAAALGAPAGDAVPMRQTVRVRSVRGFQITAVQGGSWLRHLGTPFLASNMGRVFHWPSTFSDGPSSHLAPDGNFLLSGADLYRLNCRACHKADGQGVPPAINSLIGPVQATSAVLIQTQMKQRGIDLDRKTVHQLVSQAQTSLRDRLLNGGERMPPFGHLAPEEMESLLAYLELLAGVPGAEGKQIWLSEPTARVGEQLVKGTCHICHESTGPGLAVAVGSQDSIPTLANILRDRSPSEVIRKVRDGLARPTPLATSGRGEMPVFGDLTPEEIGAAYTYLALYPPRP